MQVNPVELSFPCPACGMRLTIQQTVANGPCPHCHIPIQVELKIGLREDEQALKKEVVRVTNAFERRRFRPASGSSQDELKTNRRFSDLKNG